MGRLVTGAGFVLFVLVCNALALIITSGSASATSTPSSELGFIGYVSALTVSPLPSDTNAEVALFYGLIMGFLLVVGVLLIITAFVPLTSE